MTIEPCAEMHLLIQADLDGELSPAEAAEIAHHVATCPDCAAVQANLSALAGRVRTEIAYAPAPPGLRDAVLGRLRAVSRPDAANDDIAPPRASWWQRRPRWGLAVPFGAGAAIAAGLILTLSTPHQNGFADLLVADHIRALQPGHLMDVVSTDQHTVKPWFNGRLDVAPPVKDLAPQGFALAGGRLDYIADRAVAALVYRHRQHVIDLYVWPEIEVDDGHRVPSSNAFEHSGYNVLRLHQGGMVLWAVSDLNAPELADFVRLWEVAN